MQTLSLPTGVAGAVWQGDQLPGAGEAPVLSSGFAALDALLPGGGWPCQGLSEILLPAWGLAECRLTAPALSLALQEEGKGKAVLFIGSPEPPHLPGWRAAGLTAASMVWVDTARPEQRLWAAEQALRCPQVAAVLLWLPPGRGQTAGLRRLQVHGRRPVFVFRSLAAQAESSPAPLRLVLQASRPLALVLRLLKRRGPAHEQPIELPVWPEGLGPVLARRLAAHVSVAPVPAEVSDVSQALLARPVPRPGLRLVVG